MDNVGNHIFVMESGMDTVMDQATMEAKKVGENKRRQLPPPRIFTTKMAPLLTDVKEVAPPSKPRQLTWNVGECSAPPSRSSLSSLPLNSTRQQHYQGYSWSLHLGSRVCIGGAKIGKLLFFGETKFAPGLWCGIELSEPVGKNDGTVCGVRYFTCEPKHGIFAPPHKVDLLKDDWQPISSSKCSDTSRSSPNVLTSPHHSNTVEATHLITTTFRKEEATDSNPYSGRTCKQSLDHNYTFNIQQDDIYSNTVPMGGPDENTVVFHNSHLQLEVSNKVPHSASGLDADSKFGDGGGATFEISNSVSTSAYASQRPSHQASKESLSFGSDKERTFSVDHFSYMQSTPICDAKNFDSSEVPGGGVLPWFHNNDSYVIHSQQDDDSSCVEDPVIDCNNYHYNMMTGARQCSVELDESLGILTPDQMKDFTLAAEAGPAQTPSDEGIQEIVEEEVVDYVPEDNLEIQENVTKFHSFNGGDEIICKGGHGEPDITNSFSGFWNQHYSPLSKKGIQEQSFIGDYLNDDLGLTNLFSSVSNVSWTTCKNLSKVPVESLNVMKESSLLSLKSIEASSVQSDITNNVSVVDAICEISQPIVEPPKDDRHWAGNESSPVATKQDSAAVNVTNILQDFEVTLKNPDTAVEPDVCASVGSAVEYIVQELNNSVVHQTESEKQEQVTSGMAVSITSIDTGYQGDAECELQSEMDTNAANTPVEDPHKEFQPILMGEFSRHPKGDTGSDSDFCSDMAASWTESDLELDDRARGRGARIIDGRLYLSNACISKDTEGTESTDSLNDDGGDAVKSSHQDLQKDIPSTEDPNATIVTLPEVEDAASDCRLSAASLKSTAASLVTLLVPEVREELDEVFDHTLKYDIVEEIRSVDCHQSAEESNCVKNDLKETPPSSPPLPPPPPPQPPTLQAEDHKIEIGQATTPKSSKWLVKMKTPTSSKKSSKLRPGSSHSNSPQEKDSPTMAAKKFKTPKKNVMSKIKAMIGATSNKLTNKDTISPPSATNEEDTRKPGRTPKKNRWDTVMSKIQAGQVEEKTKGKKEIVSKVNTNRMPSKSSETANSISRKKETSKDRTLLKVTTTRINKMDTTNLSLEKSKVKLKSKDLLDIKLQSHNDSTMVPSVKSPSQTFNNRSPSVSSVASNTSSRIAVRVSRTHLAPDGIAANSLGSSLNVPAEKPSSRKAPSIGGHRSPLIQSSQPIAAHKSAAGLSTHSQGPATLKNDHPSKLRGTKGAPTHGKPVSHSDNLSVGTAREISRLEALCESRTKELNFVRLQLKHCALGFDSMAILLQYLIERVGAFSVPSLNQEVQHIQRKWQATHAELEEAKAIQKSIAEKLIERQKEHADELLKMNSEFDQRMTEVEQRLSMDFLNSIDSLKLEHQKELEALKEVHSDEVADIHDFYHKQENTIKRAHQEELKQIQEMILNKKDELSTTHSDRTTVDSHDKCCEELNKLRSKIEDLTLQCVDFDRLKSEYQHTLAHDPDTRVQIISARNVELQKEVESLKVVLELRQADVLELRRKNESFILQAEELVKANEEIKKLRAKKEDLEALVEQKAIAERQLSIENQRLKDYHEKELNMSKRLSMENEELQWRLRQGKEMSVSMSMTEGTSFDMAFNKSGTPSSMSMYFWDNEGLSNSGACPFSQFRTSGPPWKSPQSSPHLSPSKSPQSAAKRPSSAHIIRKERGGSSSSKRLSSTSEDENVIDWEDVPVRFRKKKSSLSDNFETNLKTDVLGPAVEENRGEADGVDADAESLVTVCHNETVTSVLEDGELNVGSCAGSELSTDFTSPEFQTDKSSGVAPAELILELDDASVTSARVAVDSKLVDDFVEVDHNRNTVLNISHEPIISCDTNDMELTSETWTKWSRDSKKFSFSSTKSFIVEDDVEWTNTEIEKIQTIEIDGQVQNVTSTTTSLQESNLQHCDVVEDEDLISTVLIWKPKSRIQPSAKSAAPTPSRYYGHTASIELIQTSSCMDVLPQGQCQDKVDDDISRTSSGEDLPEDTLSTESLVVGAPFEGSPFEIVSDECPLSMKTAAAICDPFLQASQGTENDVELTKSPKKTTTLVITYRASRPSISSSRDSSPVNQLGGGTSTAGSDLSDSSGTDSSSSSSCRASPVGGEPLPNKVIKLLENSMFTGTRSPRTSAGESMMMFDDCATGAPSSSDPSHVLLKKVFHDHLLLENEGSRLCSNSIDSCSNREQSMGGSPIPVLSKPDTPDMINHPSVDAPNASTADESWSDDDLPSESEV